MIFLLMNHIQKKKPVDIETFTGRTARRFTEGITVTVINNEKKNISKELRNKSTKETQ